MATKYSENISCRHCYNLSKMEILGDVGDKTDEWEDGHGGGVDFWDYYELLKCPRCKQVNIRVYHWSDLMVDEEVAINYNYIYPSNNNIPTGLPETIAKAYNAAELVRSIDVNAYATLLRRLLEMVCYDRQAKSGTLDNMLQDLATKGEIPQKLVKVASGLRNFGNMGAHAGSGDLSEEEIPIVKALTNSILEYVYSAPYLEALATKKLDEIKSKKKEK